MPSNPATNRYRDPSGHFIETATAEFLNADLRFSQAIFLPIEVTQAGPTKIVVEGVFRYSDRQPQPDLKARSTTRR